MTNKLPLVTIGMPCYNAQDTVIRALRSALIQTWDNFEILLIDDCSTDNTVDLIAKEIQNVLKNIQSSQASLPFVGRRAAASPATGVFDRHLANQKNILRLAVEAHMKEIQQEKEGVSLVKYKLPIE